MFYWDVNTGAGGLGAKGLAPEGLKGPQTIQSLSPYQALSLSFAPVVLGPCPPCEGCISPSTGGPGLREGEGCPTWDPERGFTMVPGTWPLRGPAFPRRGLAQFTWALGHLGEPSLASHRGPPTAVPKPITAWEPVPFGPGGHISQRGLCGTPTGTQRCWQPQCHPLPGPATPRALAQVDVALPAAWASSPLPPAWGMGGSRGVAIDRSQAAGGQSPAGRRRC